MNNQMNVVMDYLEKSYGEAKMPHDEECMVRISRTNTAFEADVETDNFTKEFLDSYYSGV